MDGWKTIPLGDALTFQRGFDITKDEQCDGPYPVISSSGPKSSHAQFKARGPGVIIGRKGSLGTVFYSAYWPHDTTLWVKDFHSNAPRFAYYFLQTMGFERLDAGASNPSLNRNHVHTIQVQWPPLPVQRRIAGILSAYDDLIENNLRRIKILEEMARLLYREWFVHFRFPGHEKVRFVDSPLGKILEGWEVKKLGDLADISWGDTSTTKASYVEEGFDAYSAAGMDGKLDHFDFERTGIVLSAIGAQCGRTWLARGRWSCIKNTIRFWATTERASNEYLFLATADPGRWPKRGAAQPFISQGDAERVPILVPNECLMKTFAVLADATLHGTDILGEQCTVLCSMRDLLLPRLLSGEIEISDVRCESRKAETDDRVQIENSTESKSEAAANNQVRCEPPQQDTVPPIDQTDRRDVLAIIRQIFSDGFSGDREDAVRAIARELGYHRTGRRIQQILDDDLRTAVRRGILDNSNGELRLLARSITDYDRDFLKKQFLAAIDRGWITRDEAIQAFARWLGFRRTGPLIDETARSLINGLLREGRLDADGPELIRRVS